MWKAEEARRAALEEDVTKKSNLNSFYKNLLDRNESYGGIKGILLLILLFMLLLLLLILLYFSCILFSHISNFRGEATRKEKRGKERR